MEPSNEVVLDGGGVGGAVLLGETVRRPAGPWTPAVHALLNHLQGHLAFVPKVLGTDDAGREMLEYLPGDIINIETATLTSQALAELARWTRQLHDACADFYHPGPWRLPAPAEANLFGHNDLSPWNICLNGNHLAGVFDWDLAGPTTAVRELATLAWSCVPLFSPHPPSWVAQRLTLISNAYGGPTAAEIFAAVFPRITESIESQTAAAVSGDVGMQRLMSLTNNQDLTRQSLFGLQQRRAGIEAALASGETR